VIPKKLFFTKGVGRHKDYLASFELALRNAGIQMCNLVSVSSIYPPGCKIVPKEKGLSYIKPGDITYVVMARNSTNEPNRLVAASVGLAIPADNTTYGYLSEHHSYGETDEKAGDYAEDLAATMLASTLGLDMDLEKAWDERKQEWLLSGHLVKSCNVTQSAEGEKTGLWTTVIAAAVFIFDENGKSPESKPADAKTPEQPQPSEPQNICPKP
jgi:arginine decarboxylase